MQPPSSRAARLERLDVAFGDPRRGVAAVGERVQDRPDPALLAQRAGSRTRGRASCARRRRRRGPSGGAPRRARCAAGKSSCSAGLVASSPASIALAMRTMSMSITRARRRAWCGRPPSCPSGPSGRPTAAPEVSILARADSARAARRRTARGRAPVASPGPPSPSPNPSRTTSTDGAAQSSRSGPDRARDVELLGVAPQALEPEELARVLAEHVHHDLAQVHEHPARDGLALDTERFRSAPRGRRRPPRRRARARGDPSRRSRTRSSPRSRRPRADRARAPPRPSCHRSQSPVP